MSLFAAACQIAFESAGSVAGVTMRYSRPGVGEQEIRAIAGSQTLLVSTDYENLIQRQHREQFLVNPADLQSLFGEPREGDQVRYSPLNGGNVRLVFTVRASGRGEPVYRPTDRFHTRWRLQTLLTGREDG